MAALFPNILKTIGRTPVVRINRLAPAHVNLYVKCEFFNPTSSIKDRLAIGIIEEAERSGELQPGQTVAETTSGNTGIGLAMACAVKGYPCVMVMPEYYSIERRKLMKFFGATVLLTPKEYKASGADVYTQALAEKNGWFVANQFVNLANPLYHGQTTGPEILSAFADNPLDYWVTGYGTGGTLTGAGNTLKRALPNIKIIAAEPAKAPLLQGGDWQPHIFQGWAPDFIPDVLDQTVPDEVVTVTEENAIARSKALASKEGLCVGISGGATFDAALQVAEIAKEGSTILAMLPDTGERYMSTALFADVTEESDVLDKGLDVDFESLFE